ncbi:putative Alkylated DNA repair protein AlkB [Seiridium cardinale]|uniref:Alkylated DNA repair protein AlkB n=1 Tax=Seiridium cardinale TaxID=138064 RepID=A0ABR2Y553_9PEZI
MTVDLQELDAHEQPSDQLRATWKYYYRTDHGQFANHPDIDDIHVPERAIEFQQSGVIPSEKLISAFRQLEPAGCDSSPVVQDAPIYFHPLLPGLLIVPSLIPPSTQKALLSRMVHRDLSNPAHQTNLHLHYDLPYIDGGSDGDSSFFSMSSDAPANFIPKDPDVHKPLSIKQVLDKKLSWVTLGGQYDWTNRVYPEQSPLQFPSDIANLLQTLFPATLAQAAIVNFYKTGDTMMMHRDVSEEANKGLVSLSIGCDALFMIAPNDYAERMENPEMGDSKKPYLLLRLKSGDAIYMTEESRYAWHGVPKVLKGTCPDFLADWPAEDGKYEDWKGWMQNKRINLNVRQVKD